MSDQNQTPRPPDGGSGNQPPPAVAPPPPAPQSFVISKDEWVDSRREIRSLKELISKLAPPAAPPSDDGKGKKGEQAPAPGPVVDADVRARLDLADAIDESGLTLTKENKALIKRLFAAEKPQNVSEWLAETAKILPSAPAAQAVVAAIPAAATATPVIPPSNTGAPSPSTVAPTLPANPAKWPEDIIRKTPTKDFIAAMRAYEQSQQGRAWNPYDDPELKPHLRKKS